MLNQLIQTAAKKSHDRGHKLDTFNVYKDGAVSCCKFCDSHVRVTTLNGGVMFGKALDTCPFGADRRAK